MKIQSLCFPLVLVALTIISPNLCARPRTVCDETSLRTALTNGGTINFGCDGTIVLSSTLQITTNTVLDGTGHSIVISGGDTVRVFSVGTNVNFAITNLTIANGNQTGTNVPGALVGQPAYGAGIFNEGGNIILTGCTISNNVAVGAEGNQDTTQSPGGGDAIGAGIFNRGGLLLLRNCVVVSNQCQAGTGALWDLGATGGRAMGAGIYSLSGKSQIESSEFNGNTALCKDARWSGPPNPVLASAMGGAFYAESGTNSLAQTLFVGNQAIGPGIFGFTQGGQVGEGNGGALYFTNCDSAVSLCKFVSNSSIGGTNFGREMGGASQGGAIFNSGNLSLADCLFSNNSSVAGFGIGGGGEARGGAICNFNTVTMNRCTFTDDLALGGGAGEFIMTPSAGGTAKGGGIYNRGELLSTNVTFASNSVVGGDALDAFFHSPAGQGGSGEGGGIFNEGSMTLVHATLSVNAARTSKPIANPGYGVGGGLFTTNGSSRLQNSIIANSVSASNSSGTLIDDGNNISSDGSCKFTAPGSLNNTDPILSLLDDFGGATPTIALLTGSPAIDHGLPGYGPATDQRGIARPFGTGFDIGAFESAPPYSVRGIIHGSPETGPISLTAGTNSKTVTAPGSYILSGFAPGTYTLIPSVTNGVIIPNIRIITVGPDAVGIDFKAYQLNTLTAESYTNQVLHLIFAGTNGQTTRVQSTTDLVAWDTAGTNTVQTNGIFDFYYTNNLTEASHFFRAATP
jgi:hypothetical protein